MKNVIVRSLSGIVYIAVFVAAILFGKFTFLLLTEFLMICGLLEFIKLKESQTGQKIPNYIYFINIATASIIGLIFLTADLFEMPGLICSFVFFPAIAFLWFVLLCYTTFSRDENALENFGNTLIMLFYIILPLSLILMVDGLKGFGPTIVLISLVGIWINDTGAFCVGCLFGKHRLCERLSPKKSWEGFWGGLVLTVIAGIIYAAIKYDSAKMIFVFAVYGGCVSVFATIGDLFESRLKRTAGVKDSGTLIPGHGGILDRIDSFLFVAYPIVLMAVIYPFVAEFKTW